MSHLHIDPADDDTPVTNSQADATAIAEAIGKVLKTNNSKPKLREPDPFDGSNPHKLRTFILQCKLNFRDRKDAFEDDSDKVNYVLSYLKGTALDCFESAILDPIEPLWLLDFDLFIEELKANFRTYNPISEAEAEFEALRMHDSHQATKYFIKFQQLASRVQWGEAALHRQAYNGLAKRIKDDMVHHDKPNTLSSLRKLMQATDNIGNDTVNFPAKLEHPDLPETSPNKKPTPTSQTTNSAKALRIRSQRTPVPAQPRTRAPLLKESPPLLICLPNSVKTEN